MKDFTKANPDVEIVEAYSTVAPIVENYDGSMHMLFEGAILAVVVVWLFLRDWRATFLSRSGAAHLSVIPTFLVMYLADFSLNTVTLLALSLVVGILVDDAIVEIENIARHLQMGKSAKAGSTRGRPTRSGLLSSPTLDARRGLPADGFHERYSGSDLPAVWRYRGGCRSRPRCWLRAFDAR